LGVLLRKTAGAMKKYFPSLAKVSQEVIATGIAIILVAYVVAKYPPLKRLVKSYETD
jgi:hypothetical protein